MKKIPHQIKPKVIKEQFSLPYVGSISIGNGTVAVSNQSTAMSSDEMIDSLKKASKKNLFPLKPASENE